MMRFFIMVMTTIKIMIDNNNNNNNNKNNADFTKRCYFSRTLTTYQVVSIAVYERLARSITMVIRFRQAVLSCRVTRLAYTVGTVYRITG